MSIVAISTEHTCTLEDVKANSQAHNFTIAPGSGNENTFLLAANSFDAVCEATRDLPEYVDPRLVPCAVKSGERKFYKPEDEENPLNAWANRTSLLSADPAAANGPLAGKTVAIKDNISVGGLPLGLGTCSSLFSGGRHPISPIDAPVVSRILAAGGHVTGTATCENLSLSGLSNTSDSGVVHNAWLPGYATGGSSSGCGALCSIPDVKDARDGGKDPRDYLLGEGVDMAVGGDQGGSIRLPASYSGIYGLKPTHGLVPYTGIASLNPIIDHTGPMARKLDDVALLLGVLAGYDGMDFRMTPESPLPSRVPDYLNDLKAWVQHKQSADEWTVTAAARGLRIGILKESFEMEGIDGDVVSTVWKAVERFESLGAEVKEISVPLHLDAASIWTVASRSNIPDTLANKVPGLLAFPMPHLDPLPVGQAYYDTLANRSPGTVNVLMNATQLERKFGSSLARKAYMHVFELRAAFDKALEDVDVLLTPVNPTVGPKHPASTLRTIDNPKGLSESIVDIFSPAIGNTLSLCGFNVTGHPAMSMPVGWSQVKDGDAKLPVGMQLVAKRWDEASIFKAAKAWEVGGKWIDP